VGLSCRVCSGREGAASKLGRDGDARLGEATGAAISSEGDRLARDDGWSPAPRAQAGEAKRERPASDRLGDNAATGFGITASLLFRLQIWRYTNKMTDLCSKQAE
jgi:hypothetical protein